MKILKAFYTVLLIGGLGMGATIITTGCATSTQESADEAQTDDNISSRVVAALQASSDYKYVDVLVHTFRRRVQLAGFVDTGHHKDQAEEVTRQIDGVKDVINNITVK